MARPSKDNPTGAQKKPRQTPEVLRLLKYAFGIGCTIREACIYAGIGETTYYEWREADEKLASEIDKLRQDPVLKAKQVLIDSIKDGDVNTVKWFLERKKKDEFSIKQETMITGDEENPLAIQTITRTIIDIDESDNTDT